MNYVVVDLEWNQALSSNSSVFNKLPIHLRGEIIEIGAVKLNDNMTLGEEFTIDIKPVYFKKMHYKVKKITGFDKERLDNGYFFTDAFDIFKEWCGDDVTFITWGCDDQGIFEQNIIIHDLDWDWIHEWINLQLIYNLQTGGGKEQKSLTSAMEHFEIEQTRVAHDALGDAYNTALICTKLNMREGFRLYQDAGKILSERTSKKITEAEEITDTLAVDCQHLYGICSKAAAFSNDISEKVLCPKCNKEMSGEKWLNQGDQRYINIFNCAEHGDYFLRLRFKKHPDENIWDVKRLMYIADENHINSYKSKMKQVRRHGRNHTSHKNRPATKSQQ